MNYYLVQPWANDPNQSFLNAVQWTVKLRQMGKIVFSPILHIHPFWVELKHQTTCLAQEAGYEISFHDHCIDCHYAGWDISENEKTIWACLYPHNIAEYLEKEEWNTWDLGMLEALMKKNGRVYKYTIDKCNLCHEPLKWQRTRHEILVCKCGKKYSHISMSEIHIYNDYVTETCSKLYYDTGITILMDESAYIDHMEGTGLQWREWLSKGCEQKYNYAITHKIRVLDLKSFLNGVEVEI